MGGRWVKIWADLEHFKASNEKNWKKIDFKGSNLMVSGCFWMIFWLDTVADCAICLMGFAENDGGQVGPKMSEIEAF
jgi:hypothetical protein